jgi:hypothetical protein
MIDPKPADIGRKVVYRDRTGWKVEEGVITSFNDTCVFVRYARTSAVEHSFENIGRELC